LFGGLKGSCLVLTFGVNGFFIIINSVTVFEGVVCTALKSGDKIIVNGIK